MSRIKSLYKQYENWQTGSNIFVISDTHFGDCDRSVMGYYLSEKEQIKIINKGLYGKNSTLIHLGDVGDPEYIKWIKAGKKILIRGNHDKGCSYYESYFDEVYDGAVLISPQIILSHEPIDLPWCFNVHGHDHGAKTVWDLDDKREIVGINLAGNVCNFVPFNLNDFANNGGLKKIPTIHRLAIEKQKEEKLNNNSED